MGKLVYFATDGNTNPCIFWAFIHPFIAHLIVNMSIQPFLFEPTYPPGEEPNDSQAAGLKHRSHSTGHSLQVIVLPF